jgi:predicted aspartyl protease
MTIIRLPASQPYVPVTLSSWEGIKDCVALIDTGASMTAVHPAIVAELEAQVIGEVDIRRPDGATEWLPTYYFSLAMFSGIDRAEAVPVEVVAATPASRCDVLIGRDLLGRWLTVYDGPGDRLLISC